MSCGFSTIFSSCLVFVLLFYCECVQKLNCGCLVKSTCFDDITTKWNKDDISKHLKTWIKGVVKLTSFKVGEEKHFYLKKTFKQTGNIVRYIANVNCSSKCTLKSSFGPTWRTAGEISNNQFHDGFLYGVEDTHGMLTGLLSILTLNQHLIVMRFGCLSRQERQC